MGRIKLRSRLILSMAFAGMMVNQPICAQTGETEQLGKVVYGSSENPNDSVSTRTRPWWKDWFALRISAGPNLMWVQLAESDTYPEKRSTAARVGGKLQVGVVMDKRSEDPVTFIVSYARSASSNRADAGEPKTFSQLNLGGEYPLKVFISRDYNWLSLDAGGFVSMCSVEDGVTDNWSSRWGLGALLSLSYRRHLVGCDVGCQLYGGYSNLFGKLAKSVALRPRHTFEAGLSFNVTL